MGEGIKWNRLQLIRSVQSYFHYTGVFYSNEYCTGPSPCNASSRGELHPTSGSLTLYAAQIDDEDVYYYNVYLAGGGYNHGRDYEIQLFVFGK